MTTITEADMVVIAGLAAYHAAKTAEEEGRPWPARFEDLTPYHAPELAEMAQGLAACYGAGLLSLSPRECMFADGTWGGLVILDWHDREPTFVDWADLEPWLPVPMTLVPGQARPVEGVDFVVPDDLSGLDA